MPNQYSQINETQFYKIFKEEFAKVMKDMDIQTDDYHLIRLESPAFPGTPDMNACVQGDEFWIECKVFPNVVGNYQRAWKKKRELAGGKVFIITYMQKDRFSLVEDRDSIPEHYDSLDKLIKRILRRVHYDRG